MRASPLPPLRVLGLAALLLLPALPAAAQRAAPPTDPYAAIVSEALRANLGLAQARLDERRAGAAVRDARGLYLPAVTLESRSSALSGGIDVGDLVNPAYQVLNQLTNSNAFPTNVSAALPFAQETWLRVRQPLFAPGIAAGVRARSSQRAAQAAHTGAAARAVAARAELAWLGVASAAQAVEVWRATLPLVEEAQRVTERLLAAGVVTPDAVLRARAERADAEQQLAAAVAQRNAAARAFNLVLNRPLEAEVPPLPDSAVVAPLAVTLEEALASARRRREELREAEAGVKATDAGRRAAGAAFLPTVALGLDYGLQGHEFRLDTRRRTYVASLVVQWSLFDGGQSLARREEAALAGGRARLAQEEAERAVELDVRQAYEAAEVAWRAIATSGERAAAARKAFQLVERRYREGLATPLELIESRSASVRAALDEILTRQAYASRAVELERAAALRDLGSASTH